MGDIEEAAKATKAVADAASKGIDAARDAGGFLDRIFGKGIEDAVGRHWSDRMTARRIEAAIYDWERLEILAHDAQERLRARGITSLRSIPPKVALPLLEHATVEHEEDLHKLWANLLATGLDAEADEIQKKYVTTLGEMTSADATTLAELVGECMDPRHQRATPDGTRTWGPGTEGTLSHDSTVIITLDRLGLIQPSWVKFKAYEPPGNNRYGDYPGTQDYVTVPGSLESVVVTTFGMAFAKAVGVTYGK